jgi:hypothetical protein
MTYTAKTVKEFRTENGSLAKKITTELGLIDTELDALAAVDAAEIKVVKGSLTAGNADAMAFAWQNPEVTGIHVLQVVIDVTTAGGTGSSVLDVDVSANALGANQDDTIIDGADLNAIAVYSSLSAGVSGSNADENVHKADENGGTDDYVSGKILVANAASLVGKYYIYYTTV